MKTQRRDDAIAKNKHSLQLLKVVVLAQTGVVLILAFLVVYAFSVKEIRYQPTMGASYTMSERHFSPSYLRNMATDIMQLRLTWNADSITGHYTQLLSMVKLSAVAAIRKQLNTEIAAVKKRNMQSVFYQTHAVVDVKQHLAKVTGDLVRTDDGVVLPSVKRTYLLHFDYHHGTLSIVSLQQTEKHHG